MPYHSRGSSCQSDQLLRCWAATEVRDRTNLRIRKHVQGLLVCRVRFLQLVLHQVAMTYEMASSLAWGLAESEGWILTKCTPDFAVSTVNCQHSLEELDGL